METQEEGLRSELEELRKEALAAMSDSGADSEMTQRCTGHIQIAPSK